MPRGDGTGPDGNGPKNTNKGWPDRNRRGGSGARTGRGMCRRKPSCQVSSQTDPSDE